ncbi:MAG: hypothetical protein Q8L34_06270, partial [Candidatus Woesearchaeota archaeon]|nr:hypothetical protein [Candidatus Woesearchaeota archaeon]
MKKSAIHKKTTEHHTTKAVHESAKTAKPSLKKFFIVLGILLVIVLGIIWIVSDKGASTMDETIVAKVNGE